MTRDLESFLEDHLEIRQRLETAAARAWWQAATSGSPEAYREEARLQNELETLLSNRENFALLSEFQGRDEPTDPLLRRLVDVLHREHLGRQCSTELLHRVVELGSEVEQRFATFRPELDGRKLNDSDIERTLTQSDDSALRRRVWEASKEVGPVVAAAVRELARLRNRVAVELGFSDYYQLSLTLAEQQPASIAALFDELDALTREPYQQGKRHLDRQLAQRFGVEESDLQPWHYSDPFFQDVPEPGRQVGADSFADVDMLQIARSFYEGIGLPVETILERSDLYERDGKNPHAFCIDLDRVGDVRILLNTQPNRRWMSTTMHELGHGIYDLGIDRELPFVLRRPTHTFVTEAIALFFGRMPFVPSWLREAAGLPVDADAAEVAHKHQALRQQVFSRWCQVMVRFERALYADPDGPHQDRWWELVERFQGVRRPAGRHGEDWAAKIHIVSTPVYYHNYAIGELLASQLLQAVLAHLGQPAGDEGSLCGCPEAGEFLAERVFRPGATLAWSQLVEHATGAPLSAAAFAEQFAVSR